MGLLDRIFGKDKEAAVTAAGASTQFFENDSQGDDEDDKPETSRNAPRRELVQVILRDTMRKHGIPSDWIECRILSTINRSGRPGLHVNFVVRQAHDKLLAYVFAFQDSFERELARFEPRSREWLLSLAWEFQGVKMDAMPDPRSGAQSGPAPLADGRGTPVALEGLVPADELLADAPSKGDDDVQRDLQALFAIRDAALADAAGRAGTHRAGQRQARGEHVDFQPTQPFQDSGEPKP